MARNGCKMTNTKVVSFFPNRHKPVVKPHAYIIFVVVSLQYLSFIGHPMGLKTLSFVFLFPIR